MPADLDLELVRRIAQAALDEDGARNDVTTRALVPPEQRGGGTIVAKAEGVVCGLPVAATAFYLLDREIAFEALVLEGPAVSPGDALARVDGPLAPILSAERVALNFLQRLSGIATATRRLVDAVAGLDVRILDTRKTTPGLRALERYAVRAGGGHNHRFNLSDAVLIKDNHLAAARARGLSIAEVLAQARAASPKGMRIEIEVTSIDEAREALEAGAGALLLDNMKDYPPGYRLLLNPRRQVTVDLQCEASRGVPQTFLDDLGGNAHAEQGARVRMSERQAYPRRRGR